MTNGSGMHRVAEALAAAETALGHDSQLVDINKPDTWDSAVDADVQVIHTHFPDNMAKRVTRPLRLVWVGHGTPDHMFQNAAEESDHGGMWAGRPIGLLLHWMKVAHAKVTFWERHKWMYDRMLTVGARPVDLVPLGVDLAFWGGGTTAGKFAGEPSVFTCENPHYIKWPYDLLVAWAAIADDLPDARLHGAYLPNDMHSFYFPFFDALGSTYTAYLSATVFDKINLRNAYLSSDFFCGLVRYGDLNHNGLQAAAAGANTISYAGNPHAKYWIAEGDQREIARQLLAIFRKEVEPRTPTPVPDITDTAKAMLAVYGDIL